MTMLFPITQERVEEFAQAFKAERFDEADQIFQDLLTEAEPMAESVRDQFGEEAWAVLCGYARRTHYSDPRTPLDAAYRIAVLASRYRTDAARSLHGGEDVPDANVYFRECQPSEFKQGIPAPDILVFPDGSGIVQCEDGPQILRVALDWILGRSLPAVTVVYKSHYDASEANYVARRLKQYGIPVIQFIL